MDVPGKRCSTCGTWRPLTDFNVRRAAPDGLQSRCRACSRAWYVQNGAAHKQNVRRRNLAVRLALRARLNAYLLEHPCVDCGERDLRLLELDHRDDAPKRDGVGRLVAQSMSWAVVEAEIDKCDVRCVGCHRIRSLQVAGAWSVVVEQERRRQESEAASARLARVLPPRG